MKKLIFLLFIVVLAAVSISGCLGGDSANDSNDSVPESESDGSVPENETNESVPEIPEPSLPAPTPNYSDAETITAFNASLVTLTPLPDGFVHLATRSVTSNKQNIGVLDPLIGYRGMYLYQEGYEDYNVYVAVYRCSYSKTADDYVQKMAADQISRYGAESVTTIQTNGHDAVLLSTNASSAYSENTYVLAWSNWTGDEYDDSYLVVVNGVVPYSLIITAAEASNL